MFGCVGCGGGEHKNPAELCNAICACEQCDDAARQKCSDDFERLNSARQRCLTQWNAWIQCVADRWQCVNGDFKLGDGACASEWTALADCAPS
jgi:hypothetical protein